MIWRTSFYGLRYSYVSNTINVGRTYCVITTTGETLNGADVRDFSTLQALHVIDYTVLPDAVDTCLRFSSLQDLHSDIRYRVLVIKDEDEVLDVLLHFSIVEVYEDSPRLAQGVLNIYGDLRFQR
jgi:hypothetical protein